MGRMGDFERDNPNGNVFRLVTLWRRAESSAREACRDVQCMNDPWRRGVKWMST